MKTIVLSRRYAEAFIKAFPASELDAGVSDFRAFLEAGKLEPALFEILNSPTITLERKIGVIDAIFASKASETTVNFIKVLLRRRRFNLLSTIAEEIERQYNIIKHITVVKVESAVPLTDRERQNLETLFSKQLQGPIVLREKIEPNIIGGLVLRFETSVIDASVRKSIKDLRERLELIKQTSVELNAQATKAV